VFGLVVIEWHAPVAGVSQVVVLAGEEPAAQGVVLKQQPAVPSVEFIEILTGGRRGPVGAPDERSCPSAIRSGTGTSYWYPPPAPWYGPDVTLPAGNILALAVCEILVHGYDLARAVGADLRPTKGMAESATAVAAAMMSEMLPRMLDQHSASGFTGGFEVRIRGGQRFVLRIADGTAWSEAAEGQDVDCVLTLSAYHALLIGYGRLPVWRGIATGKAWAFGRRPWLGPRFPGLFLTA